ncbi:hypothetical protein G6F57_020462 [Rhizopus arrhizus]|nr:hypothetical protein G6F57_020462 [Rhizopus arrhizus]
MASISVDLPMPLGPINATCSPGASRNAASASTSCPRPGAVTRRPGTSTGAPASDADGTTVPRPVGVGLAASSCGRPSNSTAICVTAASAVARS